MDTEAERAQLLAAILAAPTDDGPRLVYADWLQASGSRLGELIVAQLEHAQHPDDRVLQRRVNGLISAHRSEVLGDLPVSKPVFRRGFIEAAEISAQDFLRLGPELFTRLPLLDELVIWLERERAPAQLPAASFAPLRSLALRYGRSLDLSALAQNPSLAHLQTLELLGCTVDPAGCQALAASPHLAELRSLDLGADPISAAGVEALAAASWAPQLRRLRLWRAQLGPAGTAKLPAFRTLEALELGFNDLDLTSLVPIAELAPSLRELSLRGDRLGPATVHALASLKLRVLDLEGTRIGDAGISELAKLDLSELEALVLSGNDLTRAALRPLLALPMPKLRRLALRHNDLGRCASSFAAKFTHTRVELDEKVLLPGR